MEDINSEIFNNFINLIKILKILLKIIKKPKIEM